MDLEGAKAQVKEKANHPTVTIGLLLFLALNIAMLVIGIIKKDECPIDHRIPLYLIVAGAVGISSKLLPFVNRRLEWGIINVIVSLLYLFEFIWTIIGSVWVYQIYKPNFIPVPGGNYCSESAYLMSFWLLTIHWIFLGLSIVFACCCCCCIAASSK